MVSPTAAIVTELGGGGVVLDVVEPDEVVDGLVVRTSVDRVTVA
jgi:hypothetical protein